MESHNSQEDAEVTSPDQEFNNTNTMIWNVLSYANEVIWTEEWWLPPGVKWEDMKSTPSMTYPNFSDLFTYPFIFGIIILIFKYCFVLPVFLQPLARACGLRFHKPFVPPNAFLQSVYRECNGKPSQKIIYESAKKLDCSERHIERWFRKKTAQDRQTKYEKFLHCGLDLIDHFLISLFGVIIMYDKPYMWNLRLCWVNYPHQSLEPDIWWYYMTGLGFYWAHLLTNCLQHGRKDKFWMILHHLCTIFLMVFSFLLNFVRIGAIILVVHEIADIFLMIAKMMIHAGYKQGTDLMFVIFVTVWCYTRIGLYIFWIFAHLWGEADDLFDQPSVEIFRYLLWLLIVLNLYWTYYILRMFLITLFGGTVKDTRSEGENEVSSEENVPSNEYVEKVD